MSERSWFAHESACIDEGAEIGTGTRIWHYSHIMADAIIGQHCTIGQNVFVASGCRVGNNVKIQNNVSVYAGVILEDDVFCGPSMVFTNVLNPRSHVNRREEFHPTRVKRGASIGANATIVCGTTLGRYCLVGAGAVVTHDVPSYALVLGNPARQTGHVCWCGERLLASSTDPACLSCTTCSRTYRGDGEHVVPLDNSG